MGNIKFLVFCAIVTLPSSLSQFVYVQRETFPGYINNKIDQSLFSSISNDTRHLILNEESIEKIEPNSFRKFSELQELIIYKNNLYVLQNGIFNGLGNLEHLMIVNSPNLMVLRGDIFNGLENLTQLNLWGNNLNRLEIGVFNGVKKLSKLDLSRNNLRHVAPVIFGPLEYFGNSSDRKNAYPSIRTSLRSIKLEWNRISLIERNTFIGMNLTELNLQHNRIDEIESNAFFGLAVEDLFLNNNNLATLRYGTFNGIIHIHHLDIRNNPIFEIENDVFFPARPLKLLDTSFTSSEISEMGTLWGIPESFKVA